MTLMTEQSQRGGANSTNTQIVVNAATDIENIRSIVHDAVAAEIYRYSQDARREMAENLVAIADKIVAKVALSGPDGTSKFANPDIQYNLGVIGREYSRSGDEGLGDLLVELLNDRCQFENRSVMAVVLNDAILTAPRLTDGELAALTVSWVVSRVQFQKISNLDTLVKRLGEYLLPFVPEIPLGESSYYHLEFAGCTSIESLMEAQFGQILLHFYPGLFSKGFDREGILPELQPFIENEIIFGPCLRDASKFQVLSASELDLENMTESLGLSAHAPALKQMLQRNLLSAEEIESEVVGIDPALASLIEIWNSNEIQNMRLTSVGIAIAHANMVRIRGFTSPLSIWVS